MSIVSIYHLIYHLYIYISMFKAKRFQSQLRLFRSCQVFWCFVFSSDLVQNQTLDQQKSLRGLLLVCLQTKSSIQPAKKPRLVKTNNMTCTPQGLTRAFCFAPAALCFPDEIRATYRPTSMALAWTQPSLKHHVFVTVYICLHVSPHESICT